MILIRT